ncbi:MAG: sulfatase [Planctomycetia bacterium]|nr:sulfatase [Planctomycetia bacterium]
MIALVAASLSLAVAKAEPAGPVRRPNIVLLLADDLGINDLGCYGRKDHRTPAIDRLAAGGVRFTSAIAAGSVCTPSRAALLTGRHPARLGLTTFLPGREDRRSQKLLSPALGSHLPDGVRTLADMLAPAGYACGYVGKWHLGEAEHGPQGHGFGTFVRGRPASGAESADGGKGELGQAAAAVAFIEAQRAAPFLLVVGFDSPHIGLAAPRRLVEANAGTFNPLYAAMIESLDGAVGRILEAVQRSGRAEETLVILTSDNGGLHVPEGRDAPPTFNAPWRAGKGFLYEGGLRVPLIIRMPGRADAGLMVDDPVVLGDLTPTICGLAGVAATEPCDFEDIGPLLSARTDRQPRERTLYWHEPHYTNQGGRPASVVRAGRWKLIEHLEEGRMELFDLQADPGERNDVAGAEPARAAALRGRLESWRRSVGARRMTANGAFDPRAWAACYAEVDVSRLAAATTAEAMRQPLAEWRRAMDERPAVVAGASDRPTRLVVLEAADAVVRGRQLRYEPQPEKDTLGCWVDPTDTASWAFRIGEAGRYRVVVLQGCGPGDGGSEVAVSAGGESLRFTIEETGHFQRFVPRDVGTIRLVAGDNTLVVRPQSKKGAAIGDIRRIQLERLD